MGAPFTSRIPRKASRTVTLTGLANAGLLASVIPIFTVTGLVWIQMLGIRCTTSLVSGGGGSLALGYAGNTGGIISATTGTDIDADTVWKDTSPEIGGAAGLADLIAALSIIGTVGTADITAGVIEFNALWLPLSANGQLY